MQKNNDLSGFFASSTCAPQGDNYSHMVPALSYSSSHFLISDYSLGLGLYINYVIYLAPSISGISCTSPSFSLGSAHVGNKTR